MICLVENNSCHEGQQIFKTEVYFIMKKKFFAVALATTMALSTVMTASAETLTGTGWWEGMQTGQDYVLSGNGSLSLDVNFQTGDDAGYGAFNVEVYNEGWFFTTGSDQNAWWAEGAGTGSEGITGVTAGGASTIVAGTTYTVTVTRTDDQITVTYANPDGSKYAEYVGTNETTPEELKVHVMAQVGTYEITEAQANNDNNNESTTAATGENQTTAAPADGEKTTTAATTGKGTPQTGDVAPIAALGAVAVIACAGVVVSRKKVTE